MLQFQVFFSHRRACLHSDSKYFSTFSLTHTLPDYSSKFSSSRSSILHLFPFSLSFLTHTHTVCPITGKWRGYNEEIWANFNIEARKQWASKGRNVQIKQRQKLPPHWCTNVFGPLPYHREHCSRVPLYHSPSTIHSQLINQSPRQQLDLSSFTQPDAETLHYTFFSIFLSLQIY